MRLVETRPVRWLMDKGAVVVCAGGGGVSTVSGSGPTNRVATGVEAVVDGDRVGQLLARELRADLFVMVTDVDAVYDGWATEHQRRIPWVTAAELRRRSFDVASMAPKAEAAIRFVEGTGRRAAIGALTDVEAIVNGSAGTQVVARFVEP
jgi:carbamate kinase